MHKIAIHNPPSTGCCDGATLHVFTILIRPGRRMSWSTCRTARWQPAEISTACEIVANVNSISAALRAAPVMSSIFSIPSTPTPRPRGRLVPAYVRRQARRPDGQGQPRFPRLIHCRVEAMVAEHTAARDMVAEKEDYRGVGTPIKLSRTPGGLRSNPPRFAEHSEDVLKERGYRDEDIAALRKSGILPGRRRR